MQLNFPIFPEQASTMAGQVDALYLFLVLITTFFSLLIALLILYLCHQVQEEPRSGRRNRSMAPPCWRSSGR